jgi:curved DNA-binding protein CbpA
MQATDHYRTLGISRDATLEDIKAAFRQQAKMYHPDVNPGDTTAEESFKRANEAYTVLCDSATRAAYNLDNAFAGYDWTKAPSPEFGGRVRRHAGGRPAWVRTDDVPHRPTYNPIDLKEWLRSHYGLSEAERAARIRAAEQADERFPGNKHRNWEARRSARNRPGGAGQWNADGDKKTTQNPRAQHPDNYRTFAHKFRLAQRASERVIPWVALSVGFLALAVVMTVQRDGSPGDGRRPVPDR